MSNVLKVTFHESVVNSKGDVELTFSLSAEVQDEIQKWMKIFDNGDVDVVFCPLPMLVAIANEIGEEQLLKSPFRGIRMEDRIKKLASIDKQCLAKGQI